MLGWFSGSGPSLNSGAFASQSFRYMLGLAKSMANLVDAALSRGDGVTLMTFSGGHLTSSDYKSTGVFFREVGRDLAKEYYGGDGRMPAGLSPANQFFGQVVGMLPQTQGGLGFPLTQWVDPSSLKLKKIGDAWYGSAHIDEEILALKYPDGVARVHLNATVNFDFSSLSGSIKKNLAQYLTATAMDRARASVWEELYANPSISSATAAQDFKEYFGLHLFNLTYGSEIKSYAFPGVSTFEVQFQWFPSLPPR